MSKGDGDLALVAAQWKISAQREAKTVPANPPADDPKANGVIEKGVQDINGRLRAIKLALESRSDTRWIAVLLGTGDLPSKANLVA